jgi:hypothetical protein
MAEISLIHYNPRLGDGNPKSYIKGGNLTRGGLLHPRIAAAKSHVFASRIDPVSMGEVPRSHEGRGLRGGSPP